MSERIKHDGSARCPVEDGAIVIVLYVSGRVSSTLLLAHGVDWECVAEYQVISGWNRPITDIFAELPDEAEWIATTEESLFYSADEPVRSKSAWMLPGWKYITDNAVYFGDWCESKRKRPKRDRAFDLAREATAGQLDSLKEIIKRGGVKAVLDNCMNEPDPSGPCCDNGKFGEDHDCQKQDGSNRPALWFVVDLNRKHGPFDAQHKAEAFARELSCSPHNLAAVFVCRAVASFTAKVERTTYENGGE